MTTTNYDNGRDINWQQLRAQIGAMNVMAISGGRAVRMGSSAIALPVSSGYSVIIKLEANDTYTVQRFFKRGAKTWIKGERTDVYADEVGNVCYYASCYKSYDEAEWLVKA